jgi:hypothetical protein
VHQHTLDRAQDLKQQDEPPQGHHPWQKKSATENEKESAHLKAIVFMDTYSSI